MHARCAIACLGLLAAGALAGGRAAAQPTLLDPGLAIQTVTPEGISRATGMRFLGSDDFFVIEKDSGKVKRVHGGAVDEVLDLDVANDGERGLVGIELHPDFAQNGFVYLYRSTRGAPGDGAGDPPSSGSPPETTDWTGNRVERYVWNGTSLVADPSFQTFSIPMDPAQGNGPGHNGGPLRFGPDGKLFLAGGDLSRERIEQNTAAATAAAGSGGIYRLNDDGTLPADNPFASETDPALRALFAYGVRNAFGLAFDPRTGRLWDTENGPDRMDEINLVDPGANSGWRILMGPESRDPEGQDHTDLVDLLPLSTYSDPEFSFLQPIGITTLAFVSGSALGEGYDDGVLVGEVNSGALYLFRLDGERDGFALSGALADLVADVAAERNSLRFGTGFGATTDIQRGPDGAIYVLSIATGSVYRIVPVPEPGSGTLLALGLLALARRQPGRAAPSRA